MPESRARTTTDTKLILKAMWLRVTVPIPFDASMPTLSSRSMPSEKKMSIMMPIVTSGMMIGR